MFWIRELMGWVLVILGLWLFYLSYFVLLPDRKLLWTGPTILMGLILVRGGIHLLKVAVAARVCQYAPADPNPKAGRPAVVRPQRRATVVPGRR